jgi:hypothetical protein
VATTLTVCRWPFLTKGNEGSKDDFGRENSGKSFPKLALVFRVEQGEDKKERVSKFQKL